MDKEKKRRLFLQLFSSEAGQLVLAELKEFCHYNDGRLAPSADTAAYIQGRRSVVCEIVNIMEGEKVE